MTDAIPPVVVTMVGTGTGDGGAPITDKTEATTPDHMPNVIVSVITPAVAILVRFGKLFLTTFVGLLTAAGIGVGPTAVSADFGVVCSASATASLVVAGIGLLKDLVTIFSGLEQKYPLAAGSI